MQNPLPGLLAGQSLTPAEAHAFAQALFRGEVAEGLLGGVLTALSLKGETAAELTGFARAMRENAADFGFMAPEALDTCGTGGSGKSVMNTGTLAGLLVAAAGGKVAKHGNRAVSGKCGSADLLEALGVPLALEEAALKQQYAETGFVFLFAPACHPAMKHAMPVRRALGVPTVFNLLGPLTNPLGARRHLLGVGQARRLQPMAEALQALGVDRAFVFHAQSGLDEIDLSGPTSGLLIEGEKSTPLTFTPEELGVTPAPLAAVAVQDVAHSLELSRRVLAGEAGPPTEFVLLNTGVALWLADLAPSPGDGVALARETLHSGKVHTLLEKLRGAVHGAA